MHVIPSTQLVRIGSVSLEEKSLIETRSEFKKQPRPLELTFHRRRNELRHIIRLTLKKKNAEQTPSVGVGVRARVTVTARLRVGVIEGKDAFEGKGV